MSWVCECALAVLCLIVLLLDCFVAGDTPFGLRTKNSLYGSEWDDMTCKFCGGNGLSFDCSDPDCYRGLVVVNWERGAGHFEYGDRKEFYDRMVRIIYDTTAARNPGMTSGVVHMIVGYAVPDARYNPVRIMDGGSAIERVMEEGLAKCEAFAFVRDNFPLFAECKREILLDYNYVTNGPTWFRQMCYLYKGKLDKDFSDVDEARLAAAEVWNHQCDEEGQSVYTICLRLWMVNHLKTKHVRGAPEPVALRDDECPPYPRAAFEWHFEHYPNMGWDMGWDEAE
jgi:hypothetical protein